MRAIRLFYRLFRLDVWHESDARGFWEWRRYSIALDAWEHRPMTPEERHDADWNWSIK